MKTLDDDDYFTLTHTKHDDGYDPIDNYKKE